MEKHMDIDIGLWAILAAAVAFIWCGCIYTNGRKKAADFGTGGFDRKEAA
jgi:hypothetical protein